MNEHVDSDSLLRLPGTVEERLWLQEHLETLSVKEGVILAAAAECSPPATMAEAVNHLLTLDEYDVCSPAADLAQLGEFYLQENCVPKEQRPYFDKAALGCWYEDEHPGVFVGGCYVVYPQNELDLRYDGEHLPTDTERMDWSVRLKLASELVPGGVWIKLPDYDEMHDRLGDIRLALDALRVRTIQECTLLDARCVLPCVQDLAGQYDSLIDLIYDGQDLGVLLDERGQGRPDFLERFAAALEYENCRRLDDAVDIAACPNSYDVINADVFLDHVVQELRRQAWAQGGDGVKGCFDYAAYAGALAARQGYCLTGDGQNYIRKRDAPSLDIIQQPGMTMQ